MEFDAERRANHSPFFVVCFVCKSSLMEATWKCLLVGDTNFCGQALFVSPHETLISPRIERRGNCDNRVIQIKRNIPIFPCDVCLDGD
jgi:hypothetical protein